MDIASSQNDDIISSTTFGQNRKKTFAFERPREEKNVAAVGDLINQLEPLEIVDRKKARSFFDGKRPIVNQPLVVDPGPKRMDANDKMASFSSS